MEEQNDAKLNITIKKHIFVVEDDTVTRTIITRILEKEGYNVIAFSSGENFFEFLKTSSVRPDLILLDIVLGDSITGVDCLRYIKSDEKICNTSVVMLTREKNIELIKEVFLLGSTDYLLKPVDKNLLINRVKFNLTLNFEISEIHKIISRLHQEDQSILTNHGLVEYSKKNFSCYPVVYKENKLCVLFTENFKPKFFLNANIELLEAHVRIFMRNTNRWNQVWPSSFCTNNQDNMIIGKEPSVSNDKIENKEFKHSLYKFVTNDFSELKKKIFGKSFNVNPTLWKNLTKWSEQKDDCTKEIEEWKEKAKTLYEKRGAWK